MGIVNANPDSFSDEGAHAGTERAVRHGLRLAEQGADVVEVGGESLRFSAPSPAEVEIGRVAPVIEALAARVGVPVAVDTFKPAVAAGGHRGRRRRSSTTPPACATPRCAGWPPRGGVGVVMTHFFGEPKVRPVSFPDVDVVEAVAAWAGERMREAAAAGIPAGADRDRPGRGAGQVAGRRTSTCCTAWTRSRPSAGRSSCRSPTRRCSAR